MMDALFVYCSLLVNHKQHISIEMLSMQDDKSRSAVDIG